MAGPRSTSVDSSGIVGTELLLGGLQRGSSQAAERLVDLANHNDQVIDNVAAVAAKGSAEALSVLLHIVSAQGLARPAIARLTHDPALA